VSGRRRRILVVLHEPGYFRLYGSTIVELGRRGWDVLLAFDRPAKRGEVSQVPEGAAEGVRSVGAIPAAGRTGALPAIRAGVDYLRYLEPKFGAAAYLRHRSGKRLPRAFAALHRIGGLPGWAVGGAIAGMRAIESLVPADGSVRRFLRDHAPDLVFVSPLVTLGAASGGQTEVVKAAKSMRIPVVVGAASWDHLTSKGLVRVVPDVLTVWNEAQRREAVELHRVPAARVRVTGAQSLDHWFEPRPAGSAASLRAALGIADARPVILFVGSSKNMAPGNSEPAFVSRWLTALRASSDSLLRHAFVLVRPHPTNTEPWTDRSSDEPIRLGAAVVPREYSGIPLQPREVEFFHDSLLASDAVVGVNTTAMIEAAIVGRPVLTVRDPAFEHSQEQTLHFAHLTDTNGCALVAGTLDEHLTQLRDVLMARATRTAALEHFVRTFVRPGGIDRRATDCLCDALEASAPAASRSAPADAALEQREPALTSARRRP
jgi:hypothetical protein